MSIQPETFPILTPGQMNPFNQALSAGLDTYQNIQKAAYSAPLMQSEIYKNQAMPLQAMTTLLTNPYTASLFSQEQKDSMINTINRMTSGMSATNGQANQPGPLHQIFNSIFGGSSGSSNVPQGTFSGGNSTNAYEYDSNGNNVKATPDEVNRTANSGNNTSITTVPPSGSSGGDVTNQQADIPLRVYNGPQSVAPGNNVSANGPYNSNMPSPVNVGGVSPNTQNAWMAKALPESQQGITLGAEKSATAKGAETAAAGEAKTYQDLLNTSFKLADTNQQAQRGLVSFKNDYDNAKLKGLPLTIGEQVFGNWVKNIDPNTAAAASNAASYVLASAQGLGPSTGKSTKYMTQLIENAKLTPEMPVETVNQKYPILMTISDRAQEQNNFYKTLVQHGITNPYEMENEWFNYNKEYPLINDKNQVLRSNLNKGNEFLNREYQGGSQDTSIPFQSNLAPNPNLSPNAKIISQRPLPTFTSQKSFQTWYAGQNKDMQDGIKERLRLNELAKSENQ
jgi:hypothetical protein